MKILIVEDEEHLAKGLQFNVEAEGHAADTAPDGETALEILERSTYDAIVLDVMMPGIDGFEVATRLRSRGDFTPILMLTARGRTEDVLLGFEAGVDDYLPKPFDLTIFVARLNSILRRRRWAEAAPEPAVATSAIAINGRTIDLENLVFKNVQGDTTPMTLMEAKLLQYLLDRQGRPVSRKEILEDVWQLQEDTDTRAIDNFIVRLRKYLEDEPDRPAILQTVRGVGYRLVLPSSKPE